MGLLNWLWAGRRRGSNPPPTGAKPDPPASPPRGQIDPAKRVTDLAAQAGLSPQDWAKAFNKPRPQPSGGRLIRGDRDPGPLPAPEPPMQPPGRLDLTWEAAIDGLRDVLADQTECAVQPVWQRSRILTAMDLMAVNSATPPASTPALSYHNKVNHGSLLDLEADFRSWYKNKYGQPYFGAIPIVVAIEWGQHLLQRHTPSTKGPNFPSPRKIREDFLP